MVLNSEKGENYERCQNNFYNFMSTL